MPQPGESGSCWAADSWAADAWATDSWAGALLRAAIRFARGTIAYARGRRRVIFR